MEKVIKAGLIGIISLAQPTAWGNEKPDTLSTRHLGEVVETAVRQQVEVIPVQTLSGEELQRINSNSEADALRGQYTFQRAIDVTNPADNYYRDQLPHAQAQF